jgi:hypothetical protein
MAAIAGASSDSTSDFILPAAPASIFAGMLVILELCPPIQLARGV